MRKIKMLTLGLVLAAIMGVNGFLAKTNSASASMELNIDNIEQIAEGEPNATEIGIWQWIFDGAKWVWRHKSQIASTAYAIYEVYAEITSDKAPECDGKLQKTTDSDKNVRITRIKCVPAGYGETKNCNIANTPEIVDYD